MPSQAFHGLLVIDKPTGITSRAALDRVQRWFPRGTRIGHTGTLDPLATGVLVVCVGVATRLAEYVQDMPKTYSAELTLGVRSDTDDADGTVTPVEVQQSPKLSDLKSALYSFTGEIDQVPPQFSAAKVSGRRAYDLARRGTTVTLAARRVTIYSNEVVSYQYPRLEIEVRCSKGTYIRSLARDLGEKLGCGALIANLRRTRVGPFAAEGSLHLETDADIARGQLLPLTAAVAELPKITVGQDGVRELLQGRSVGFESVSAPEMASGNYQCAAIDETGRLIAVGKCDTTQRRFVPEKVIADVAR